MNYFGEDGPEPMAPTQPSDEEQQRVEAVIEASKDRYLKFFMVDFVEMSMRKVATQNITFCANQAKLFDNLMDDSETQRQQRQKMNKFENCLGKHTDSLEHALSAMMMQSKQVSEKQSAVYEHEGEVSMMPGVAKNDYEVGDRGEQYLLSTGT